ncbi:MAG: PIN domain-containing protein [Candidatus Heimdallarchaeota archaeon]|nr:PIN domain-containing protein [Candidatus Heimdallarchaeota archaeon]
MMNKNEDIFIDANFLIYLNTTRDENELEKYSNLLEGLLTHSFYTNLLVLDELLYISKRKYSVSYTLTFELIENTFFYLL